MEKEEKIFFSHSSKNKEEIRLLVELVEDIGIPHEKIICTSIPGYGVPEGENIYKWIKKQIGNPGLRVIYLLSQDYYTSPICLNEMGAAWATGAKETIFLINGFEFSDIKGCLDSNQEGINLSGDIQETKYRLNEFKNKLISEFELPDMNLSKWERRRDLFMDRYLQRTIGEKESQLEDINLIKSIIYKLEQDQRTMLVRTYESTGYLLWCVFDSAACVYAGDYRIGKTTIEPLAYRISQSVRPLEELKLIKKVSRYIYQLTPLGKQVASHIW